MSNTKFVDEFIKLKPNYEKLGSNVQQSLEIFLNEQDIPYLSIKNRVKDVNSYLEKIDRKGYKQPRDEIEDICGIRIICYFQNDIEKIKEIIFKEFDVTESQSKQELLNANEFGYRSTHFIAKIKDSWTSTPNYRGLNNLKFEIQVRTILMHSWAEIEHKLAYKSEVDIPKELRRKFSFISAVLEDADIKFEEIKDAIAVNKTKIIQKAKKDKKFDYSLELNLDNLQAFLDFAFKDRYKDIDDTSEVLSEMLNFKISFYTIIQTYEQYKNTLPTIEDKLSEKRNQFYSTNTQVYPLGINHTFTWTQCGALRALLKIISPEYLNFMGSEFDKSVLPQFKNLN